MKNNSLNKIKSSGFKLPDSYFDSFEERIFSKVQNTSQLDLIKGSGFNKPDGYFDSLEENIKQKLSNEPEVKVIKLITKRNLLYLSGIAAAILILFNLTIFDNKLSYDNLEIETVENYLIDESISSYEIAALLSDEDIDKLNILDYNISEDHIEKYLLDNADIESLIIE